MMQRIVCASLASVFLSGCATEWRADQPATAVTYQVPAYRAERSIGNFRRLGILPVRVRRVGTFSVVTQSERMEAGLVYDAASYLSERKGYEVVPVVDRGGVWRPEVLLTDEFGSLDDLREAWERARTEEEIADAVRKIGRALNVDGVVSIWLEEYGGGSGAEGGAWAITNLFLANVPLFYALWHTNAEAVVYEVFSGHGIWRNQLSGGFERRALGSVTEIFFENLENAIPAQLAK